MAQNKLVCVTTSGSSTGPADRTSIHTTNNISTVISTAPTTTLTALSQTSSTVKTPEQISAKTTATTAQTTSSTASSQTSSTVKTPEQTTAAGITPTSLKDATETAMAVSQITEKLNNCTSINQNEANNYLRNITNLMGPVTPDHTNSQASVQKKIVAAIELLLQKVEINESVIMHSASLIVAVKKVNGTNFQKTSFTMTNSSNLQIDGGPTDGSTPQASIMFPDALMENLNAKQRLQASRIQFSYYQTDVVFQDTSLNSTKKVISGVLGSSVSNLTISNLRENITITLRTNERVSLNNTVSCSFWDFHSNNGSGGWSVEGCTVLNWTENETVCSCNHLTNFGVLLDISNNSITSQMQVAILNSFTYIGCSMSSIFLTITLFMYLRIKKLRKDIPNKILIQLCLALLFLNLVFLLDSFLAKELSNVGLCISTAFFLCYFLLASFTWMSLESFHMYLSIVKVFNNYIPHFMIKITVVGWGIPLVVVALPTAVFENSFGFSRTVLDDGSVENFCWWTDQGSIRTVVVVYFCVTYALNFTMFIVVMVLLCRIKRSNPHCERGRTSLQDVWSVTALAVLLGLTWAFGLFFVWKSVHLVSMYLFTICNSLQGFFIFVFRCATKEEFKRMWRKYICCGKLGKVPGGLLSGVTSVLSHKSFSTSLDMESSSKSQSTVNFSETTNDPTPDTETKLPEKLP
ncbi:adhesion G-protein coupled receptor G2-like [Astyanax mexicanus]|uniref:Adhesion G-protein coupled receptor G2-like n=1 Tax=Astyanax mexicanus TaxID=7994 RepID=A0A8T2L351_ASTMX|nr:adhesion G-protein coupled receptor G2-like [Astyanax mexicanus]